MQAVVICNPVAGSGRGRERMNRLSKIVGRWPWATEIVWTAEPGDGVRLAGRARAAGARWVIAAGGDGTAAEVVNGLLRDGIPDAPGFGYLPIGSGCDFARSLDFGSARTVAEKLPDAVTRKVDIGSIEVTADDGTTVRKLFLNAVNVGLASAVLADVRRSRWLSRLGRRSYAVAAAIRVLSAGSVRVELSAGGQLVRRGAALNLSVCNGAYFGGGLRPCPRADLGSGTLDVAWIEPLPVLEALLQLRRLMRGAGARHPAVHLLRGRSFEITGEQVEVEVDGEIPGRLPARISVLPGALKVLAPVRGPRAD